MYVDVSGITKEAVKMLYFQALESMFLLVCLWGSGEPSWSHHSCSSTVHQKPWMSIQAEDHTKKRYKCEYLKQSEALQSSKPRQCEFAKEACQYGYFQQLQAIQTRQSELVSVKHPCRWSWDKTLFYSNELVIWEPLPKSQYCFLSVWRPRASVGLNLEWPETTSQSLKISTFTWSWILGFTVLGMLIGHVNT